MSEESDMMCCCASCGATSDDDINLKLCNGCKLVRYCGVKCQREHRVKHKEECKKRAAELRDEILFRQPESSHLGDCPICFLPHPLWTIDRQKSSLMSCCSKLICKGCSYANTKRMVEGRLAITCAFCRQPYPKTLAEADLNKMKRAEEANDSVAIREVGAIHYGKGDYSSAFDCWTKAAKLGDAKSHYQLSALYMDGLGVQKNKKKDVYHLKEAAIRGHVVSRFNLGVEEKNNGKIERAVKHFIIAANHGYDDAIDMLRDMYALGLVTKGEFAAALRSHQAAVDATKSPHREEVESMLEAGFDMRGKGV